MSVPWRTEFSWLTVEVRAFIDLLCLGQTHHLGPCNASQPPAALKLPSAPRGISHFEKDKPEDKRHYLFVFFPGYGTSKRARSVTLHFALVLISNRLNCDKNNTKGIPVLVWQVLPISRDPGHIRVLFAGEKESSPHSCGLPEVHNLSVQVMRVKKFSWTPKNLAGFLEPAGHGEESP